MLTPRVCMLGVVLASLATAAGAQGPAAPDVWAAKEGADVSMAWDPVATATGYRVYRTADLAVPFALVGTSATPDWRDVGAVPGPPANPPMYHYYVTAENASGEGPASNLAFKLNLTLANCTLDPCLVSLPYRYLPAGLANRAPSSLDFCRAEPALRWIDRFDFSPCVVTRRQSCSSSIRIFDLDVPGAGFWLTTVDPSVPAALDLVGAHDPALEPGGTASIPLDTCTGCRSGSMPFGRYLVSLPWHGRSRTAAELCGELGPRGLLAVLDEPPGAVNYYYCGTAMADFSLVAGRAYQLLVTRGFAWQPEVWP